MPPGDRLLRRGKGVVVSGETAWRVGLGTGYKEHSKKMDTS